jgi:hypothetical protein
VVPAQQVHLNELFAPKLELLMPVPEQAELFRSWADAAAVKFRLCSCAGCSLLALATVNTCHRACEELFDSLEDLDNQAPGWQSEREATGRAFAFTLALHMQLFLAIPAQVGVTKARMETAEQILEEWDALAQEPFDLLICTSDDTKVQVWLAFSPMTIVLVFFMEL